MIQSRNQTTEEYSHRSHTGQRSPRSVINIHAVIPKNRHYLCPHRCPCSCHNTRRINSPHVFHKALGSLFVGYSGLPYRALGRCDVSSCLGHQRFQISVMYLFPLWFLYGIIRTSLVTKRLNGVDFSLKLIRNVPPGAEIIRVAGLGDINGIQRLFSQGAASPNDIDASTRMTPLIVRSLFSNSLLSIPTSITVQLSRAFDCAPV